MTARDLIRRHEGCTLTAIRDTHGWSIGWGHDGASEGDTCSQEEADARFDSDYNAAAEVAMLVAGTGFWPMLSEPRRAVLIDMAYEMGGAGLSGFKLFLALVRQEAYGAAAQEMLRSKWANQVPHRAKEDSAIMESGEWPAPIGG